VPICLKSGTDLSQCRYVLVPICPSADMSSIPFDLGDLVCTELVSPLTTTYRYAISRVPITTDVVSSNLDQDEVYNNM
jgi:hypothetical protein